MLAGFDFSGCRVDRGFLGFAACRLSIENREIIFFVAVVLFLSRRCPDWCVDGHRPP